MKFPIEQIQNMIYEIRGHRVMLDSDLARLYGVETKVLNRQVRRNLNRFPEDFMFELSKEEHENLRCQIGTSSSEYGGRRYQPLVFTENGVAMLSSVLKSEHAVMVNIAIMRVFTTLRGFHLLEKNDDSEIDKLKNDTNKVFKIVFERLDDIEDRITPRYPSVRRKIGLK